MNNFYVKYADDLPYPLPDIEIVLSDYLEPWKKTIISEINIINSLFFEKYLAYISPEIKSFLTQLATLMEQYRYLFIEQFICFLNARDKFYITMSDPSNLSKVRFLKEIYNNFLLIIENFLKQNKILVLIYEDKLEYFEKKRDVISPELIASINNIEYFKKLNFDLLSLEKELNNNKNNFSFKINFDKLYPSNETLNDLYKEFNQNNMINNKELEKNAKKYHNDIITSKLLNNKVNVVIKQNDKFLEELGNLGKIIQEIKDNLKEIKEKQNNYCVSSLVNNKNYNNEFNQIKNKNMKMIDEIEDIKKEINKFNIKHDGMNRDIEKFEIKYKDLQKTNEAINQKINNLINKNNHFN